MRWANSIVMVFVLLLVASCSPITSGGANQINGGLIFIRPNYNFDKNRLLFVGPGAAFTPAIFPAKNYCEGSAGGPLPPLTLESCVSEGIMAPVFALETLGRETSSKNFWENAISYKEPESLFVRQSVSESDCWAAVLEMARSVKGLPPIGKDQIKFIAEQQCKNIRLSKAADTYEIMFSIYILSEMFKEKNIGDYLCDSGECIVDSFTKGHAVIMLRNNHATLISGVKYHTVNGKRILNSISVLDPLSGSSSPIELGAYDFCHADAFIAY